MTIEMQNQLKPFEIFIERIEGLVARLKSEGKYDIEECVIVDTKLGWISPLPKTLDDYYNLYQNVLIHQHNYKVDTNAPSEIMFKISHCKNATEYDLIVKFNGNEIEFEGGEQVVEGKKANSEYEEFKKQMKAFIENVRNDEALKKAGFKFNDLDLRTAKGDIFSMPKEEVEFAEMWECVKEAQNAYDSAPNDRKDYYSEFYFDLYWNDTEGMSAYYQNISFWCYFDEFGVVFDGYDYYEQKTI